MREKLKCPHCGQDLPAWDDVARAIEDALTGNVPAGLRPMMLQAARELRMWEQVGQQHGFKKHV